MAIAAMVMIKPQHTDATTIAIVEYILLSTIFFSFCEEKHSLSDVFILQLSQIKSKSLPDADDLGSLFELPARLLQYLLMTLL